MKILLPDLTNKKIPEIKSAYEGDQKESVICCRYIGTRIWTAGHQNGKETVVK